MDYETIWHVNPQRTEAHFGQNFKKNGHFLGQWEKNEKMNYLKFDILFSKFNQKIYTTIIITRSLRPKEGRLFPNNGEASWNKINK